MLTTKVFDEFIDINSCLCHPVSPCRDILKHRVTEATITRQRLFHSPINISGKGQNSTNANTICVLPKISFRILIRTLVTAWQPVLTAVTMAVTIAKIQFLTIFLVVTCFLGGVVSVTDKEFAVSECI